MERVEYKSAEKRYLSQLLERVAQARQYKVADSESASACLIHGLPVEIITDNNPLTYVPM